MKKLLSVYPYILLGLFVLAMLGILLRQLHLPFANELMILGLMPQTLIAFAGFIAYPIIFGLNNENNLGDKSSYEVINEIAPDESTIFNDLQTINSFKKARLPRFLGFCSFWVAYVQMVFSAGSLFYWLNLPGMAEMWTAVILPIILGLAPLILMLLFAQNWTGLRRQMAVRLLLLPLVAGLIVQLLGLGLHNYHYVDPNAMTEPAPADSASFAVPTAPADTLTPD